MKLKLDTLLTMLLVVCALVTTGLLARREIGSKLSSSTNAVAEKPIFIQSWRSALEEGARLGPTDAPVHLIEFADFECPFCGDFYKRLRELRRRYPTQVALTFIHFPLPGHRFALPAARVAECAGDQGRFESMYDQLFEGQGFFGLKSWDEYAAGAGVPDLGTFDACIKKTDEMRRVEDGKALGTKLDVRGTPTLIVNGWKLPLPPTVEELDGMVKAVLAGKSPISGRT